MVRSIRERPRSFTGHQHATSRGVIPRLWLSAHPVNFVSRVVSETSNWLSYKRTALRAGHSRSPSPQYFVFFDRPVKFFTSSYIFFAIYVQQVRPARSFHLLIIDGFTRGAQADCKLLSFASSRENFYWTRQM